ncbi:MAG: methyltransferase domain-containing protein [Alphaproteobacteria bacterium]|nr:MAG: methyltransferase domain-containing protein [Alphaproteobacteria bacterium]
MKEAAEEPTQTRRKLLVNLGSGPKTQSRLPAMFADWREFRVDVDPGAVPDLVADITDLSAIKSGTVDAVWSAHCIEHLYLHQVGKALTEVHRILADDGFLCLIVPDLQAIASYLVNDRLLDIIYQSPAGPVTAHDVIFGFGGALARGHMNMAHHCGFTAGVMLEKLKEVQFAEIVLRRRSNLELAALACKRASAGAAQREALLAALEL